MRKTEKRVDAEKIYEMRDAFVRGKGGRGGRRVPTVYDGTFCESEGCLGLGRRF